jgi:hypothetical protein
MNAIQLLKRNRWTCGVARKGHNAFADDVIGVALKAPLPTRQPFQNPPKRARVPVCLFLLESRAGGAVTITNIFDLTATKEVLLFAIGDAPIHADHSIGGLFNVGNAAFEGGAQVDLTLPGVQTRIAQLPALAHP